MKTTEDEHEKKFKEVTPEDSILVRGTNIAFRGVARNLESLTGKLPLENIKNIPEYKRAIEAIEDYRKAVIEKTRYFKIN